jgi:uncharacterized protein (TIGR02147 family)
MVEYNQCNVPAKKKVYEAKLLYLRELFKVKTLIPELYDYYHEWYHGAIREVIKKGEVKNDPAAIGQNLVPVISEEEARNSIELLVRLNFITKTGDGMLVSKETPEIDATSAALAQKIYYEQMAELAAQSLYTQGPETQDFESITLSLPQDKVGELRAKIQQLMIQLGANNSQAPGDAVFQLNIQLFAITKAKTPTTRKDNVQSEAGQAA